MSNSNLIIKENERPKLGKWIVLSFQHVFAMFSATVLVPMLTGLPISVALFASGVGTLIYILCTKGKVPIYLGSSFAYITYIVTASTMSGGGLGAALTGLLIVGLIYVVVAIIIKFVGSAWINKILSPIVIGPTIIVIGLTLASSACANAGLVANGDYRPIIVAILTMVIVAIFAIKGKGMLKIIPFLLGIVGGYIIAILLGLIPNGEYGKIVNFQPVVDVLKDPSKWFGLPAFRFLGFEDKHLFGDIYIVKINFAAAISVIPLAFVTMCEHIGDHKVLGSITGKDYLEDPGLHRTLLGDGIATGVAALIGGPANTSYGENTSVVGISKVGSVYVTGGAAVIAIILSFCNVITTLIATIPNCVMGGVCLILYGFIASNGLKTLFDAKVDMTETRNLIIISVMLVVGLGGAVIEYGYISFSGMALSAVIGILLDQFLPGKKKKEELNEENREELDKPDSLE